MPYRFILSDQATDQLDELPETVQLRVLNRITQIPDAPRGRRSKKLQGFETVWAVRVGDYRLAYAIDDDRQTITLESIGHRRDFYPSLRRLPHLR